MKIEINEPRVDTIFRDDVKENELFILPFDKEGRIFIKIPLINIQKAIDDVEMCNAMCLNDGSFRHFDYDTFVVPCESKITLHKMYKSEGE